jgi:hypothetical protein
VGKPFVGGDEGPVLQGQEIIRLSTTIHGK